MKIIVFRRGIQHRMPARHVSIFPFITALNLTVENLQLQALEGEKDVQMVEQRSKHVVSYDYWDERQIHAQAEIASGE